MKIKDFATLEEYEKLKEYFPSLSYSEEMSDSELDEFDEKLENEYQYKGYDETETGYFLGNMIAKLRNNPKY